MTSFDSIVLDALPGLVELRRELHAHPEIRFQEQWTSDRISRFLETSRKSAISAQSYVIFPAYEHQTGPKPKATSPHHASTNSPPRPLGPTSAKSALSAQGAAIFRAFDHHTVRKSKLLPLITLRPKPQPRPLMADFGEVGLLRRSLFFYVTVLMKSCTKAAKKAHSESLIATLSQYLHVVRRCREQRF